MPDFIVIPTILIKDKNLQPLDHEVYGIIYWASKMRNEKCIMSNETIAKILNASTSGVSHSISRLAKGRYVYVDLDKATNQRKEIVPLISFKHTPSSNELGPSSNELPPPSSNELHNNSNNNNKEKNHEEKKEVTTNSSFVDSSVEAEQRTSKNSLTACTDLELWTIAKSKNLRLEDVKFKHKQIMDMIADGEFQQRYKKHKTVYRTLQKWLDMSVERGYIQECNEIEAMIRDNQHPDIQAQVKWATEQAKKRGDV